MMFSSGMPDNVQTGLIVWPNKLKLSKIMFQSIFSPVIFLYFHFDINIGKIQFKSSSLGLWEASQDEILFYWKQLIEIYKHVHPSQLLINATLQKTLLKNPQKQRHEIVLIRHNIVQTPYDSVAAMSKLILYLRMNVQYNANRSAWVSTSFKQHWGLNNST